MMHLKVVTAISIGLGKLLAELLMDDQYDEDGKILKSSGLVLFDEEKDINNFYLPNEISKEL